jgi:hypothetical protein
MTRGVGAEQLLLRRTSLDRLPTEPLEPVLPLRMAARRMEPGELGIGQEVDSAPIRSASRPRPQLPASSAARAQVGS